MNSQNTSDPEARNPVNEGTGAIASDSLAAESINSGGKFGENPGAAPLSVSGSNSTFKTSDTSGATTLPPAPNATERVTEAAHHNATDEDRGPGGQKYPEGLGGQGTFDGQHNADGYAGGASSAKQEVSEQNGGENLYQASGIRGGGTDDDVTEEGDKGDFNGSPTNTAPTYVSSLKPDAAEKPKGKNITEGGFDSDPSNNASFNNEIGTENDPGRAAEQKFQTTAQSASGATGPKQKLGDSDKSQYDVLQSEQNL